MTVAELVKNIIRALPQKNGDVYNEERRMNERRKIKQRNLGKKEKERMTDIQTHTK